MLVYNSWEALAYIAKGYIVKELDASLYCDYSCLRGGCRSATTECKVFEVKKPDEHNRTIT